MRSLVGLDYAVIATYLAIIFAAGIVLTRRASQSMDSFFLGGRGMSWWLIGISMAATNFSIDTPIAITKFVTTEGVAGVWFFWANGISAMLVTFLFARFWRRSGVLTDAELIELRYSGKSAAALRLFKGFYFGVLFNAFIMGWVFLALIKVINGLTSMDTGTVLIVATLLVFVYTLASGFYGVVITDFIQYFVALIGSILLAVFALNAVGGPQRLVAEVTRLKGARALAFVPEIGHTDAFGLFLTYAMVQWWAHKYADGGGKHIQRMLSAKNEQHAFGASFLYSIVNYSIQVWPWIVTALCSLVLLGQLDDPETAYPRMMVEVLPPGLLGLVVVGLIGAFMSTIDTHLNLGASYMVNDIYRRFLVSEGSDKHYVFVSRLMMVALLAISVAIALNMDSVASAWKFLLTFASGAGLTWIVRWFWWRANAWTEFAGMVTSGVVASYLQWCHGDWLYSHKLLTTVAITTPVWMIVTLLTPPVPRDRLVQFYDLIRPGGVGWSMFVSGGEHSVDLRSRLGLWLLALVALFSLNFGIGNMILARYALAWSLVFLATGSFWLLLLAIRRSGA